MIGVNETERLDELVREHLQKDGLPSHGWDHVQRTLRYALLIAREEHADLSILVPAVLVHDIDRTAANHEESDVARKLLTDAGFTQDRAAAILDCVKSHSTFSSAKPASTEQRILFDADKIESLGPVGAARFFMFAGENHWDLKTALQKAQDRISEIGKRGPCTREGSKLSAEKAKWSLEFFRWLAEEVANQ